MRRTLGKMKDAPQEKHAEKGWGNETVSKEVLSSFAVKRKIEEYENDFEKDVLQETHVEKGAEIFLAASLGSNPAFTKAKVISDIVEAIDPTRIYGLVMGFMPPKSCDPIVIGDIPRQIDDG